MATVLALDRWRHPRSFQYEMIKFKFTDVKWGRYRCGYIVSCNELSDYLPMDESGHNCCASKIVIAEEVSIIIS